MQPTPYHFTYIVNYILRDDFGAPEAKKDNSVSIVDLGGNELVKK